MFSSEWVIQSWRARHWVMQDAMFSGWKLNLAPQACGVLSCCCSVEGHWHRSGWEWGGELELQMPESSDSVRVFNKASRQSPVWFALLPIKFSRLKKSASESLLFLEQFFFTLNFWLPTTLTAAIGHPLTEIYSLVCTHLPSVSSPSPHLEYSVWFCLLFGSLFLFQLKVQDLKHKLFLFALMQLTY